MCDVIDLASCLKRWYFCVTAVSGLFDDKNASDDREYADHADSDSDSDADSDDCARRCFAEAEIARID
jgi:hypothetical protein